MKNPIKVLLTAAGAVLFLGSISFAQYDDLYYNPDQRQTTTTLSNTGNQTQDLSFGESYSDYDGESYDYQSDYDFYYSSRIRRFHRPNRAFDFYDPFFVDLAYYGYYTPGVTIYVGPTYHRPWRPRPYHFGHHYYHPFHNPWAFHNPYRPFRPYGSYHSFGFGYGYNSWGWGGYGYGGCPVYYSSNTYYVNNYYNNNNNQVNRPGGNDANVRDSHYGPRNSTGGTTARRGRVAESSDPEMRVPERRDTETTRTAQESGVEQGRTSADGNLRGSEIAEERTTPSTGRQSTQQRDQISSRGDISRTSGTGTQSPIAAPSRRVQEDFSNNRVSRENAAQDTRSNVPQTRSMDSGTRSNRIFDAPRTNTGRQNTPDTRRQQGRELNRGNQNRSNPTPNINRDSSPRNSSPAPNINRGNSPQRGSGTFSPGRSSNNNQSSGVSPGRSTNNTRSSGVAPSRSSNNSSSGNTRSGRSGRGGE